MIDEDPGQIGEWLKTEYFADFLAVDQGLDSCQKIGFGPFPPLAPPGRGTGIFDHRHRVAAQSLLDDRLEATLTWQEETGQFQVELMAVLAAETAEQKIILFFFIDPDSPGTGIVVIEPSTADRTGDRFDSLNRTNFRSLYDLEFS